MLIAEDLLLLLMDDETGTPAQAGTMYYALGGAVLAELALLGRVEAGRKVVATGDGPLPDPLLREAYEKVAGKERGVQTLLIEIGSRLWEPLVERLLERGLIRREQRKVLGLFRVTRLPAADAAHEAGLRRQIRAALVDGEDADPRTAALIALLSASGALPMLRPQLAWSGDVYRRAKEYENGNWGAGAVSEAVTRTAAAIAASTAVVAAAAAATTN